MGMDCGVAILDIVDGKNVLGICRAGCSWPEPYRSQASSLVELCQRGSLWSSVSETGYASRSRATGVNEGYLEPLYWHTSCCWERISEWQRKCCLLLLTEV